MNFTQPQDFQYVQGANVDGAHPYGDLNRIEIDNDIMPVRNTEDKRKLRGIDIAFLMEAVEERARFIGLDPMEDKFEFSRNITIAQINAIIERYEEIRVAFDYKGGTRLDWLSVCCDWGLTKAGVYTKDQITGVESYSFGDYSLELEEIERLEPDEKELLQSKVLEIYTELAKVDFVRFTPFADSGYDTPTWSNKAADVQTVLGEPPQAYINQARNSVVSGNSLGYKSYQYNVYVAPPSDYRTFQINAIATQGRLNLNTTIRQHVAELADAGKSRYLIQLYGWEYQSPQQGGAHTVYAKLYMPLVKTDENFNPESNVIISSVGDLFNSHTLDTSGKSSNMTIENQHNYPFMLLNDRTIWKEYDDEEPVE